MKSNKKALLNQREVIEKKLESWVTMKREKVPPSGWIKAIRGALGITARQLGERFGSDHSSILRLEQRESEGKATLEMIEKAAQAMNCKLIYAIVPNEHYENLEAIIDHQAMIAAKSLTGLVAHSMRLEKQGVGHETTAKHVEKLAEELKRNQDPMIWEKRK